MVEIAVDDEHVRIDVKGLHWLWAVKRRIELPRSSIRAVRRLAPDEHRGWWKGWRIGTHIPGVFVAGTYLKDGERHFWDVLDATRAIAIELDGAPYDRIFVEVADPERALQVLAPAP